MENELRELQKDLILDDIKAISKNEAVALELLEEYKTIFIGKRNKSFENKN